MRGGLALSGTAHPDPTLVPCEPSRVSAMLRSATVTGVPLRGRKMIGNLGKQLLPTALSLLLVAPAVPPVASGQQAGSSEYPGQGAPLSAAELQQLVAPIALYPDALVAQILGAATFPDQVAAANGWLQENRNLSGSALMQAVDAQPWDPSVKALTQFPSVVANLAKNLSWTSALGEAYHTQPTDLMSAVQTLRAEAKAAGNLKSGSQITVVQQSPEVIVIQPTSTQVVYVPEYNPTVVYGTPIQTPGYSAGAVAATALIAFGVGVAVGSALSSSCCSWGYSSWNCNWHGGAVVYRSNVYYGNSAWHGGVYGSSVTAVGPGGAARVSTAYNPSTGASARGATVATPYGTRSAAEGYNPSTGTYARSESASGPAGSIASGQTYNARTGTYTATTQAANAYGSAGSSVMSRNGETAYTQHQSTAQGTVASAETSSGGRAVAGADAHGNTASAAQTADGTKYAGANGNVYKNSGSGWSQVRGSSSASLGASESSAAARGWGQEAQSTRSTALGGGGWQSRAESARGSFSRGGGGGFRGRR